ncbi:MULTISPECIES: hypothetical protein [unclassified Rhodococcus (in: high G+C Gram-positive bacteria)]|uniref:hypothetical protein n=1 Tax=unclassified Rhodococcus (in: high G+C Gram-positive bacteria) TaxID=192944 RepID=UPI00254E76BE|nr:MULTISPECIES: hypothetical protein [unclassified Rhodococcus (in: high G+C Gram-positive bacteria)]MDQ1182022.1 hypothetical protein [Rhodococcus sp. SORGH_AS_0301]MDQ1203359.1 hypothetical protein [Rhodococcus sp. SORGH_AS_0303]
MTSDPEQSLHERIRAAADELVLLERLGAVVTERIRLSLDARAAIDLMRAPRSISPWVH